MFEKEDYLKWLFYGSIGAIILVFYLSMVMGQNKGSVYYYGVLAEPILIIFAVYINKKMKDAKAVAYINRIWGKADNRKRNLKNISALFKVKNDSKTKGFFIDDQTWNDLTMDDIFKTVDRTISTPGEEVLYDMLRRPIFDKNKLKSRNEIIEFFKNDKDVREKIQLSLYKVGRNQNTSATSFLWGDLPEDSPVKYTVYVMSVLPLVSLVSGFFIGFGSSILMFIVSFIINMIIHHKVKENIEGNISAISNVAGIVTAAKGISEIKEEAVKQYADKFKVLASKTSKIPKKAFSAGRIEGIDLLMDYVYILFLVEEVSFFSVLKDLRKHVNELKEMYILVGELDAIISISSYRRGIRKYTYPNFTDDNNSIVIKEGIHPLVKNAVPNSIEVKDGGIILTGSNMSGKSTFLRTLGVNALFAQTLAMTLCEAYEAPFLKVMTSISPQDDINSGKSYYLSEAEALLRIIKSCEDNVPSLCIIDEIFRGTNPIERIASAAEILDYLSEHNALTVVATHDIELTSLVKKHYECYYFTENVEESGFTFDYKIRQGVSNTRNALKLLKFLGYPDVIIDNANNRILTNGDE